MTFNFESFALNAAEHAANLLRLMHQRYTVRMAVLLLPGVVASKVVSTFEVLHPLSIVASSMILVGVVALLCWPFLAKRLLGEDADAEEPTVTPGNTTTQAKRDEVPGAIHVELVAELVAMYGGDAQLALKQIALESELMPTRAYLAAIEQAHLRKTLELDKLKPQSESST